jgi:hypothetical protein
MDFGVDVDNGVDVDVGVNVILCASLVEEEEG